MSQFVLILGGKGRIGSAVANDILNHTQANITITGRSVDSVSFLNQRVEYLRLDLQETEKLREAIAKSNLVIHCAGPFHHRDTQVLEFCIDQGINYLDVSDHSSYTQKALKLNEKAVKAGVTAIINTGVFPGISNSLVRQLVDKMDIPEKIHLSYLVSGSGGAGITVMRTTFLGLQQPFTAWINGKFQLVKTYTDREEITFPKPYQKNGVYWFDMPENVTLPKSFPDVKTVITKFGSVPDFYNHLTWMTANIFPQWLMQKPETIEFLSQVSYQMTNFTDQFTGVGVAVRAEVTGKKNNQKVTYTSSFVHENTAVAAGMGTGSIAKLLLTNKLTYPGVSAVEVILNTELFTQIIQERKIDVNYSEIPEL
ncbi:MAG: NAD-dependent epimerase/dehydratase family protein [Nostocales cyanobacterium]|nr:MAG: NAD-dependent epimerase/dehydratase family protein [Nostocales cyanobacterium]TAF19457.1 MAG: NAD-dependent epimerase/dehydratase family protein [Nostocales cyanobacterium]